MVEIGFHVSGRGGLGDEISRISSRSLIVLRSNAEPVDRCRLHAGQGDFMIRYFLCKEERICRPEKGDGCLTYTVVDQLGNDRGTPARLL